MGTPGRFPVRENGLPKGHGGGHPACTRAAALSSAAPNTRLLLCQGTRQAGAEADADARVRYCIPTWPCAAPPAPAEPAPPAKPAPTKPAPTKPAPAKPAPTKPAPAKPAPAKPAPTKPAPAKPAPAKPAPTKPAPAKPAPAKPAPAAAAGGTAAEGEEHPGVPLSPLLQQPCLLLTHFWPASPHEAQHLPPPCRVFPFFFSVKRALSYQNPSSRGVRYSSPAFIYWNCTASNKHTFPAAEQRRRCPQRSRGPGSTRSPLPAVRARSRALGLEASRASACERERKHWSWRRARASPAEGRALRQQGRERQPQGPTCGCFTRLAPRFTPVWICAGVGAPHAHRWDAQPLPLGFSPPLPTLPFLQAFNNKGLRSAPLGRAHSPNPCGFCLNAINA
ncbi:mucin-1-like isoform X1 [Falco peregrinus]|uniref:mucin-1-like isoform X1 n=1 Tax=Falco peregrinus TaxID=8954 RepID=UPI00247A2D3E|nr:mucin-1-like isoform X1 [Falco peregrinus]XP_055672076.1 mucin-1-like isoform X1 [Falco peregrinus]